MTDFELRRRTPAGQLRYLAEQVARTNGLDADDRVRLAAVQLGLEQLADELEADVPSPESLGESLGLAMAAMLPDAEPVFCHHEHAQHSAYTTHQAGWGRKTVRAVSCPTCKARAESTEGEPVLAPTVLNTERCTQACTERHTNGPDCLMAPDWSKPLTLPQAMELHSLTGRIIDQAQRDRWTAAGRCGMCGWDGDRSGCQDCGGGKR